MLEGELITGEDRVLSGRVWVQSMDVKTDQSGISDGDVVVVGNRAEAQRLAIDLDAALVLLCQLRHSHQRGPDAARERGAAVVVSPLDSYVSGRMITLAAPCSALMEKDPLTVTPDFLVADMAEQIKEIHYNAAVVIDGDRRPSRPDHPL